MTRLRRLLPGRRAPRWGRALRGVGALLLGVLVVLNHASRCSWWPSPPGALLLFFGTTELLALIQRLGRSRAARDSDRAGARSPWPPPPGRSWWPRVLAWCSW